MRQVCLPYTDLPGTSHLFADYIYHFDRTKPFYLRPPGDFEAPTLPLERRLAVVAALRKINGDSPALDQLELQGTVAVVTGQQVGLFSGPAYTIYKALTAAKLARRLSEGGMPAVPVFWLATEDHDFAEIDHARVFKPKYEPITLRATGAGNPSQPVGGIPIRDLPLGELRSALAGFTYADEVLSAVEECYRAGRTFGEAFRELIKRLLSGYGLIFFDPMDAEIRRIAAPFLREAYERGPELVEAVLARSKALVSAGYHAQVLVEPNSSFFFWLENGKRVPLQKTAAEIGERADLLSPNALLRPVMQDWLLPTVAYIGGPAELAYLAQSAVIYEKLLGRAPAAVSRTSFTILDEKSAALMEKFDLTLPACLAGEESVRAHVAERLVPPHLEREFRNVEQEFADRLDRLERSLLSFDPTLSAALAKSRKRILYQIEKNRGKVAREALRRDPRILVTASHLSHLVCPERHLQERYYTLLPFLAKHGMDLVDTLYEAINWDCSGHMIVTI
jgi:bacillithiol biosynthesis cysteine-adding enzyme BshC